MWSSASSSSLSSSSLSILSSLPPPAPPSTSPPPRRMTGAAYKEEEEEEEEEGYESTISNSSDDIYSNANKNNGWAAEASPSPPPSPPSPSSPVLHRVDRNRDAVPSCSTSCSSSLSSSLCHHRFDPKNQETKEVNDRGAFLSKSNDSCGSSIIHSTFSSFVPIKDRTTNDGKVGTSNTASMTTDAANRYHHLQQQQQSQPKQDPCARINHDDVSSSCSDSLNRYYRQSQSAFIESQKRPKDGYSYHQNHHFTDNNNDEKKDDSTEEYKQSNTNHSYAQKKPKNSDGKYVYAKLKQELARESELWREKEQQSQPLFVQKKEETKARYSVSPSHNRSRENEEEECKLQLLNVLSTSLPSRSFVEHKADDMMDHTQEETKGNSTMSPSSSVNHPSTPLSTPLRSCKSNGNQTEKNKHQSPSPTQVQHKQNQPLLPNELSISGISCSQQISTNNHTPSQKNRFVEDNNDYDNTTNPFNQQQQQQQQQQQHGKTIPISVLKSELDLEEDELRCLENHSSSGISSPNHYLAIANNSGGDGRSLPRYNDATLALRILMEALARLGRLDDVERFLSESLGRELRHVAELEQARTYTKLERRRIARLKKKRGNMTMNRNANQQKNHLDGTKKGGKADVKPLRQHLVSLLFAYENVMTRLTHMAQMLRYRIANDATLVTPSYTVPSSALHSILVTADRIIQREIKDFLRACLTSQASTNPSSPKGSNNNNNSNSNHPSSLLCDTTTVNPSDCRIFSLGIISNDNNNNGGHATDGTSSSKVKKDGVPSIADHPSSTTTFGYSSNMMDLPTDQFVTTILFPRTNTSPSVRHALAFRSCLAKFNHEITLLREELAIVTNEDTSSPSYQVSSSTDSNALEYLDSLIGRQLLPLLQDEAVQTTVSALESDDAFLPVFPNTIYTSLTSSLDQNNHQNQPLCMACQVLLDASAPLFSALRRLPKVVENLYSPLVAVLEHAVLAFISRAKKRVRKICGGKKADDLLGGENSVKSKTGLSVAVELRNAYLLFMQSYEGGGVGGSGGGIMNSHAGVLGGMEGAGVVRDGAAGILPLAPSTADTRAKYGSGGGENKKKQGGSYSGASGSGIGGDGTAVMSREREDEALTKEMDNVQFLFRFKDHHYGNDLIACTDDELMHAASLAHSLLKLSVSLEKRLRRETTGSTRALREAIGTIRTLGRRMTKFCRIDVLVHTAKRIAKICKSSALLSSDTVRIPTCVNDLGDFLTNTSDILRETGGNGITAYSLSNLEQYIPLLIMQSVRNLGLSNDDDYGEYGSVSSRKRRDAGSISMQGIESLARSGSVLYRDLKNAVGFEGSFWDDVAACDAFERGDSFVQLLELDAKGLEEYYLNNKSEFSDNDYKHMFSINCPNRKGDSRKFNSLKR